MNNILEKLGEKICRSQPAFHALTGCDQNPAFYRKGNNKPFGLLQKSTKYQEAFINIHKENISFANLEEFVCRYK